MAAAILAGGFLTFDVGFGREASAAPSVLSLLQDEDSGSTSDREANRDAYLQRLADRLGIDVTTLKDALKATSLEELELRVADGTITQEMADQIRDRIENGDALLPFSGFGPGHHHGHRGDLAGVTSDELATFLGIDTETLRSDRESGQTLAEIAEAAGKSRDELKAFITDELTTSLNEKVAAGDITQEQADERLATLAENLDDMIDRTRPARPSRSDDSTNSGSTEGASWSGRSGSRIFAGA
jgi:AraC-like DNA-binding protein